MFHSKGYCYYDLYFDVRPTVNTIDIVICLWCYTYSNNKYYCYCNLYFNVTPTVTVNVTVIVIYLSILHL